MQGQQCPTSVSTKLQQVAELSKEHPQRAWTTLAHLIDHEFLCEAYRRVRKDGAPGVDGQTAAAYAENLEANLAALHASFHSGTYRAPPVRRVHIPKGGGKLRPIGIPTFEDKILQKAVTMLLEAVYEQDFLDCSYGFRPGRSQHQALQNLRGGLMNMFGGYVLELDIESFFDSMSHSTLRSFLDKRIRDGVLRRAIGKWLKAGVLEEGSIRRSKQGSPQGGVVSPLLSNIFLHEVLDLWFDQDVQPRMRGRTHMVRFADDAVLVFEREDDARRVMAVLPKRFARFGLRLHPTKTRQVAFVSPGRKYRRGPPEGPGSFDFLGFTHYWGKSRKGNPVVRQKTAKGRLARSLRHISEWCRQHRHVRVAEQHKMLVKKMIGHYGYYGITGNHLALKCFAQQVPRIWRKWLDRRSWRSRMNWERFSRLLERYPLPEPRIVHSYVASL